LVYKVFLRLLNSISSTIIKTLETKDMAKSGVYI